MRCSECQTDVPTGVHEQPGGLGHNLFVVARFSPRALVHYGESANCRDGDV